MIKKVISLANKLDDAGYHREAGAVDGLLEELSKLLNEDIDLGLDEQDADEQDADEQDADEQDADEQDADEQIKIGSYTTKNFEICQGAIAAFRGLADESLEGEDLSLASAMAKDVDSLLGVEKAALERGSTSDGDLEAVITLSRSVIYDAGVLSYILDKDLEKDFGFLDMHIQKIAELMLK
jgi:hypothetical protein